MSARRALRSPADLAPRQLHAGGGKVIAGTGEPPPTRFSGRRKAAAYLAALRTGAPFPASVAVVAAHPDDESLGLGGRLATFQSLTLVHLTDGAPEAPEDASRAGFSDRRAYAQAREAELKSALAALGAAPEREFLGLKDQEAAFHLVWLAERLVERLAGVDVVLTHAYEGGHPDHDAASFAVQLACSAVGADAPLRMEFASYHLAGGQLVTGCFWPAADATEVSADLDVEALARKREAIGCFETQSAVTAWFNPAREVYRLAPTYEFTAAPPPGAALYDQFGWPLTSSLWREQARAALRELGRGGPA